MKIRPATIAQQTRLTSAITHLRQARDDARRAHCPKLTAKIHRALTSAGGAERHMWHRLARMKA